MAKNGSNVRLFAADGYTFKCWIDPREAGEMLQRGQVDQALHPTTHQLFGYKLRESFEKANPARPRPSQSSITLTETLLNVGLPRRSNDSPAREAVEAAQDKIRAWPYVWNERATIRVEAHATS